METQFPTPDVHAQYSAGSRYSVPINNSSNLAKLTLYELIHSPLLTSGPVVRQPVVFVRELETSQRMCLWPSSQE